MTNLKTSAKRLLSYELSVIPTLENKIPALTWKPYQAKRIQEQDVERLFTGGNIKGLAIICGAISGGLEVIDVDTKYDITGTLWDEIDTLLQDNLPEIYSSLVVAKTVSGGYHIYYRCKEVGGNDKLANRPTTEKEREETYQKALSNGSTEQEAKTGANNDKVRVLVETRGEGGYVVAPETPGYSYVKGDPGSIPTITPEQRAVILSIGRSFNETPAQERPIAKDTASANYSATGLTPYEDYNSRGDVVALLEAKGWRVVSQTGQRINLLRPGTTDSKTSGNFHTGLRVLRVFSSSTEFETDKGYSSSQVYCLLECNGDTKLTYRRLLELGYGEPYNSKEKTAPTQLQTERIRVEGVSSVNRVNTIISTPGQSLKIENIQTAKDVVIISPGAEATDEVLKAIALIQETGKRIYIQEGDTEIRSYQYELQHILNKYGALQGQSGGLTDRQIDSLLEEVVEASAKIPEPTDRDRYKKMFTSEDAIKELGITEESLTITVDRLTTTIEKEAKAIELHTLIKSATDLQSKGDTAKAIEKLETGLKEVRIASGKELLPPLNTYSSLLEDIATIPPAYKTGYKALDKFVGITPGAITLIAGRPSHGKTTFMYNLLFNQSRIYTDQSFYFFTYEEPVKNLSIKLINTLTATDLSGYFTDCKSLTTHTNYEFIKLYIKEKRTDIKSIEEGKGRFRELIDSQRIRLIERNYSVEELSSLLAYLNKKEKIGGVFIDYIQRMRTEKPFKDTTSEIAYISKQSLQIAKDTGLPIILGAQLNRTTSVGHPTLENLKASGSLEEDSNTVLSVYNESRERADTPDGESYSGKREVELEIRALKNREGEVNQSTKLTFDKWTGVISDLGNPVLEPITQRSGLVFREI